MMLKPLKTSESTVQGVKYSPLDVEPAQRIAEFDYFASVKSKLDHKAQEFKTKLQIKLGPRDREIRISHPSFEMPKDRVEEQVPPEQAKKYLVDLFYEFLMRSDQDRLEEAFLTSRKIIHVASFCKKNFERVNYDKEVLMAKINEAVFLQNNMLTDGLYSKYTEILKRVKELGSKPIKSSSQLLKAAEFKQTMTPKILALKIKLRILLSLSLFFSEKLQHDKAIVHAKKAFKANIDLLVASMIICYATILEKVNDIKSTTDEVKKRRKEARIRYYLMQCQILESIYRRLESCLTQKQKSSKLQTILDFFQMQVDQTGCTALHNNEIDFSSINNFIVFDSSHLKECTILNLTKLGFLSFEEDIVASKLKHEVRENSLLEKTAYTVVTLYVLATEHRFKEHKAHCNAKFYKTLLDYFNPSATAKTSEFFLGKAVELSYLYLPDSFPFVSQIFNVFKKFELNRSKIIPENFEEKETCYYLFPYKNGFKSSMIIPVVRMPIDDVKPTAKFVENKENIPLNYNSIYSKPPSQPPMKTSGVGEPKSLAAPNKFTGKSASQNNSPDIKISKQLPLKPKTNFQNQKGNTQPNIVDLGIGKNQSLVIPKSSDLARINSGNDQNQMSENEDGNQALAVRKPRVGSSKPVTQSSEKQPKYEKRANSSEFARRTAIILKNSQGNNTTKFPAKTSKVEMSFAKTTDFFFAERPSHKSQTPKTPVTAPDIFPGSRNTLKVNSGNMMRQSIRANETSLENFDNIYRNSQRFNISLANVKNVNFFIGNAQQRPPSPKKSGGTFKINNYKAQQKMFIQNFMKTQTAGVETSKQLKIGNR
ncbi:MAG: hypothetical protein IM572_08690 [Chitinophagaceae bacterium]|nr:hypothetical protein [Chitinophagaceae bacterium]